MGGLLFYFSSRAQEVFYTIKYDLKSGQQPVDHISKLDDILSDFKPISAQALDSEYYAYTKYDESKYKKLIQGKELLQLEREDFFKFIVDDIRIHELITKDKFYRRTLRNKDVPYPWLINKKVLHKLHELIVALEREGYDSKAFVITNGHRHPRENERVGGASQSRHMLGEAIDISIKDIDKSGSYEDRDKQIVLKLLEEEIIKDEGGVGLYPGTRAVHFDVRGYRARWNSY